jgi:Secretion system C-terminal sorting domain
MPLHFPIMKKLLTLAAILVSGMAFSRSHYWEAPAEEQATSSSKTVSGFGFSEQTNIVSTEQVAKTTIASSFKAVVAIQEAEQNINPPVSTLAVTAPHVIVWGTSPFQDSMWAVDTTAGWSIVSRIGPTLPGFTITGMNGLAMDPTTFETYVIMKLSAVTGRVLGKIDLTTGVCTQVGNLGDNFSSITFGPDGQLYGATGNGATVPETLYKIDKTTGVKTLMYAMGNGADGEIISYNQYDNFIYHWSGNSTIVFEKMAASNVTYTPTNIPISGTTNGETFGAICLTDTKILLSNISSTFNRIGTNGQWTSGFGSNPDDLRGLVIKPDFAFNPSSICVGDTVDFASVGTNIYKLDTYMSWGDGDIDTIAAVPNSSPSGSHIYTTVGTYTINVILRNDDVPTNTGDTLEQFVVTVNGAPVVTLSTSNPNGAICPGDTGTLIATAPLGTYQWYQNGILIPTAVGSSYSTLAAGTYNMRIVDLNGCSDSALVPITLFNAPNPVVSLGADSAYCVGTTLDAGNAGATFLWQDSLVTQTYLVTNTGTYSVMVTDSNMCMNADTINVTINPIPVVNIGPDTAVCVSITLDAGNVGATYMWCDGSTAQTTTLVTSGTCQVIVTDANGCASSDTITVIVNALPTINPGPTSGCGSVLVDAGAGFTSYLWCDNSTGQTNLFTVSASCAVMVTDSNGCSNTDTVDVQVFTNPTVTASSSSMSPCLDDANTTLTGSPAGGIFSGPGVTGTQFDPSIGVGAQVVTYNYTDVNGCSGSTNFTINVNACVGINEAIASAPIAVYPNPGTGVFNITLAENSVVNVYNATGQLVTTAKYNAGTHSIDGSTWAVGTYTLQAVTANSVSQIRLVITR